MRPWPSSTTGRRPRKAETRSCRRSPSSRRGLISPELLQRELAAALGSKPDAKAWTLLTIALGQVGMKMTALAATMDADNVDVVAGTREQITPFTLLQNWARSIMEDADPSEP